MNTRIATVVFLLVLFCVPVTLSAIGVSVSPPTLSLTSAAGKEATARFTVRNPSKEVGLFEAYPEEFEEYLTLVPSRFVLEAGEKREVLLRAKRREEGFIRTAIAIEAQPLGEPALDVGGGVRLPFSLEVSSKNNQRVTIFASGFASWVALLGIVLFLLLLGSKIPRSFLHQILK